MAVPRDTVWKRDPHTAEKHAILRGYLNAWWPIILQSFPSATYAEGFAGPGEYEDGEDGSPIEALHALLDRPNQLPEKPARFVLIEAREDRVKRLSKVIEDRYPTLPSHVDARTRQGSCEHLLLPELDEAGAWGQPVFAMLDPFNVEVPYPLIQRIGVNGSSEVLVTFMSSWLTRWASDEDQDQGDRMFGDQEWRKVADVSSDDKKAWLVSLYRRRLAQAGFRFQTAFELVNPGGQAFFLVFATTSKLGVEKMKDAMWARDRVHGVRFRDPRSPDQLSFDIEDHPDLRALERLLADHLELDQPTPVEAAREWTLLETAFRPPHAQQVLKRWADTEYLEVVGGGRLLKASTVVLRRRPPLSPRRLRRCSDRANVPMTDVTEATSWWADDRFRLDLADVLDHINTSRAVVDRSPSADLDPCESLFKALNKLMSALRVARPRGQGEESDTSALRRLIGQMPPDEADTLWDSSSVKRLIQLEPGIEDHFILRRHLLTQDIPPAEREQACAAHERVKRRYDRYADRPNAANRRKLGDGLAELLWVVRSNLAHGEKTAAGRDDARNERNRQVSSVTVGALQDLFDTVLGHPSRKILVYGTLMPGHANHAQLAAVEGVWDEVTVRGVIGEVEGLPAFRWNPHGEPQRLQLLESEHLPRYWQELDRFEGAGYQRVLVSYSSPAGVANVYEHTDLQ